MLIQKCDERQAKPRFAISCTKPWALRRQPLKVQHKYTNIQTFAKMLTDRVAHKKKYFYNRNVILYFWNASFSTLMAVLKNRAVQNMPTGGKTMIRLKAHICSAPYRLFHRLRTFYMTNYLLLFRLANLLSTESIWKCSLLSCELLAIMREKEWKRKWIDFPLLACGSHLSCFGSSWFSDSGHLHC